MEVAAVPAARLKHLNTVLRVTSVHSPRLYFNMSRLLTSAVLLSWLASLQKVNAQDELVQLSSCANDVEPFRLGVYVTSTDDISGFQVCAVSQAEHSLCHGAVSCPCFIEVHEIHMNRR